MFDRAAGSTTKVPCDDDVTSAVQRAPSVATRRDSGLTALILGFFAAGWFSWTPKASGALAVALQIGSAAAVIVAVFGGVRAIRAWPSGGVLNDPTAARRYGLLVGVEFAVGGVGAGVLVAVGAAAFVPVWICAVVGVHFFPLASVLRAPLTRWLGIAVTTVSLTGLLVGVFSAIVPSTVTGPGAGVALLGYSILMLVGSGHGDALRVTVPDPKVVG
jgi:hypothetical protein